jgi:hypothetical protein
MDQNLEPLFCGYSGTFNFYMFDAPSDSLMRFPLAVCKKVQWGLNLGAESSWFSPCLIYVGVKR